MAARFGGDGAALFQAAFFGSDDFEVERACVAIVMKNADITHQVDVAPAIGLILRITRAVLAAFAVANVYVFDA